MYENMYEVKKAEPRAFRRESVIVTSRGKRVCSASMSFVQWMHDYVPKKILSPEQVALVGWYEDQVARGSH